jgi:hypothetical protein
MHVDRLAIEIKILHIQILEAGESTRPGKMQARRLAPPDPTTS